MKIISEVIYLLATLACLNFVFSYENLGVIGVKVYGWTITYSFILVLFIEFISQAMSLIPKKKEVGKAKVNPEDTDENQ